MAHYNGANAFETELTGSLGPVGLTLNVLTTSGGPASPCVLVIDPNDPAKREYILCDGVFTGTSFVTTNINNRYLSGSAAASGITHDIGAKVRYAFSKQDYDNLKTEIDARLPLAGGTMTGDIILAGAPTANLEPATKLYVDGLVDAIVASEYAITAKNSSDLPSTYPVGVTHFNAGAAPDGGVGYDAGINSSVITFNYGSTARIFQLNITRNPASGTSNIFIRGNSGADGWAAWRNFGSHASMEDLTTGNPHTQYSLTTHTHTTKGALVSRSGDQAINLSGNAISWNVEDSDPNGMRDAGAPTRLTIPTGGAGRWAFKSQVRAFASGYLDVILRLNGVTDLAMVEVDAPSTNTPYVQIETPPGYIYSVGDYLQVFPTNDTGDVTVYSNSWFSAAYLGPT